MFTQAPLNKDRREIRLVQIRPLVDGQVSAKNTIALDIKHASLDEPGLSYAALSYVWGSATNTTAIDIEGASFNATLNLHLALKQLRMNAVDSWLWIDAICIKQTDLKEKSWQINAMRDIYSGADMVYMWLGPGTENSDAAMDFLSRTGKRLLKYLPEDLRSDHEIDRMLYRYVASYLGQLIGTNAFIREPGDPVNLAERIPVDSGLDTTPYERGVENLPFFPVAAYETLCDFLAPKSPSINKGIRDLLARDYWQRIWIVQEVCLARKTCVMSGSKSVSLDALDATVELLWRMRSIIPYNSPFYSMIDKNIPPSVNHLTPLRVRRQHQKGLIVNLVDILWTAEEPPKRPHYSATDPRDIAFGLLGVLADHERNVLRADYFITRKEVFVEITATMLSNPVESETLPNFTLDCITPGSPNGRLPTWVPDWQEIGRHGLVTWPISYGTGFKATASRRQSRRALYSVVRGVKPSILQRGCYVDRITEVMKPHEWTRSDDYSWPRMNDPDNWFFSIAEFVGLGPEPSPEEDYVWRMIAPANDWSSGTSMEGFDAVGKVPGLLRKVMRVQDVKIADLTGAEVKFIFDNSKDGNIDDEALELFGQRWRYHLTHQNTNRTLFKTANGMLGLGHAGIEVDDVVALIWKAPSPIILKRRVEGGFYFKGGANVDGIMHGEFLDTKPGEVEFRIF
ncbi:heterokaryon incompatibility protein-domain-containing protein [Colletotrichum lupini]|nr:heterokaryon incompatibility protein-domain-containing protein [Colletotrichum lupini]